MIYHSRWATGMWRPWSFFPDWKVGNTKQKWHSGVNVNVWMWNWLFERSFYAAVNEISHWRTSAPELLSCVESYQPVAACAGFNAAKTLSGRILLSDTAKKHFGTIKLLPYSKSTLDIEDRERQIDFRECVSTATAAVIRVFARWEQISYCLPGLGADGHNIAALQIRGGGGWWRIEGGNDGLAAAYFSTSAPGWHVEAAAPRYWW